MSAHASDRLLEVDLLAVDLGSGDLLDLVRELVDGDAAEQPPVLTGLRLDADRRRVQPVRDGLRRLHRRPLALLVRSAETLGVLHGPLGRGCGQPLRDEEVPGVAVGDLDDVTRRAQLVDLSLEDDLHRAV